MRVKNCLKSIFIIPLLIGSITSLSIDLKCNFTDLALPFKDTSNALIPGTAYTCILLTEISSIVEVASVENTHVAPFDNTQVKVLIADSVFNFFPSNLETIFTTLEGIYIESEFFQIIRNKDIKSFTNLKYLAIVNSALKFLEGGLLNGVTNLINIDFSNNPLFYIDETAVDGPTGLTVLRMKDLGLCGDLSDNYPTPAAFKAVLIDTTKSKCATTANLMAISKTFVSSYLIEKSSSDECKIELETCSVTTTTQSTTTITTEPTTTTLSDTTTTLSTSSDGTTTLSTTTLSDGTTTLTTTSSTISTSTDILTTLEPDQCKKDLDFMVLEKNKYLNYTEVCVAQKKILETEVEELKEELTNPVNTSCRFKDTEEGYSCTANKISIKTLSDQKVLWTGTHNGTKKASDVKALVAKFQVIQLFPLEVGKTFANIEKLIIESSGLQKIAKNDFVTLEGLTKLSLTGNEIASIDRESFDILVKLIHLDLSGNKITSFPSKAFDKLAALTHLDVSGNQLMQLRYDLISTTNVINHFFSKNNLKLSSVDILFAFRLSKASIIDFSGTECDVKFDKEAAPSTLFKDFFNILIAECT